jgi:hypothetical protein
LIDRRAVRGVRKVTQARRFIYCKQMTISLDFLLIRNYIVIN